MTSRKRYKLLHRGYEYIQKYAKRSSTLWRCIHERHGQCKGKAKTRQIGQRHVVTAYGCGHNHPPSSLL